ncbi:unnamed protein product [Gemmata massiliana]|uniref:Uncharacterized protein n=1 Tax=Gemmata massiliana TaxID=1210884 RepID=A0A6P2DAR7_9BACT|nr:hypothetical protein [Gemmata massiliana]VTR98033.1 unnamed protein product [Gemmata massiliana]
MEWSESHPQGDYYTLFELRYDGDVSHKALAEFWRGILTDGRRLAVGWDWGWLVFQVTSDKIWAWLSESTTHSRRVRFCLLSSARPSSGNTTGSHK